MSHAHRPRLGHRPLPTADVRLVPSAAAAWIATAVAMYTPPAVSVTVAAFFTVLAAMALGVRRTWAAALAAALAFAAGATLGTAARVAARDASPLARLGAVEAVGTLEVVLEGDPHPLVGGLTGQPRVLLRATARSVRSAGRTWQVADPVVLLAEQSSWGELLPGQQLRTSGRLLPARDGELTAATFSARGPPTLEGLPPPLQRAAGALRAGLVQAAEGLPPDPRGLLPGLVVGDTSGMDAVLVEQFRETGLSHLVAVSGANCAIVVGTVLWLLRRLRAPRIAAAVAAGLALAGFVVLVRPSPSVLRAATMGAIVLIALASGRPKAAVPALAGSVLVLVLVWPDLAWSPGFALSVLATAGILAVGPWLSRWLRARSVPAGLAEALAVSIAAGVATAPLIAALSSSVSLVSVPANLLAAPAVPPATVLGVLATLVAPVSPAAAEALVWLAGWPTRWLVEVAAKGSGLPDSSIAWPGGASGAASLAVLLIGLIVVARRLPRVRAVGVAAAGGLLLVGLPLHGIAPGWPPPGWVFVACDVGQGDALVVNAGPQTALVIDTGPDPALVDSCLREVGVRRIPLLVLTHMHADHADGLSGVLRGRSVGLIEVGPLPDVGLAWPVVRATAAAAGVPITAARVGEQRSVAGVDVRVLAPEQAMHGTHSDPNNSSLVLSVNTAGITILCTGDIEVEGQQSLLREYPNLHADVLKVPHHGSAYQEERFLETVGARVAIISVGVDNDYGHPSAGVVRELRRLGMRVLRTDVDGTVALGVDSGGLWVTARAAALVGS